MLCAPNYPLSGRLDYLPSGKAGARATVRAMRALVDRCKVDPRMIQASVRAIYLTPEFDDAAEITSIYNLVSQNVRYVKDVCGIETLCDPITTLNRRVGDCDDQSTLLATMLEAVGYPTRFVIAGYQSNDFEHVYLQVWAFDQWLDLDPTERGGVDWAPPNPTIIEYEKV